MAEGGDVRFQEGMSWLPPHVHLHAACHPKGRQYNWMGNLQLHRHQHHRHHRLKFPAESPHPLMHMQACSKSSMMKSSSSSSRTHQRAAAASLGGAGNGMQAIFLDSGPRRPCGTGVFLPRRAGLDSDSQPALNKPACSPVLLPSRVVRALNLNVHELRTHIPLDQDIKNNPNSETLNLISKKPHRVNASAQPCAISPDPSSSLEILLPNEWTY
ncbi:uncharacterized protein LOC131156707 [Malania oleifera]|uniref:uncharacterized protein LOC131156707 n=1 Tax=Malania oleifera TaxID=397392 RepID=UPI0025AECAAA|nr:uncharacterized protein LOC131156707 [Malania oleifera]